MQQWPRLLFCRHQRGITGKTDEDAMRILFILPYDNTYRYKAAFVPSLSYQPLTLSSLAALVPQELNAEITLADEGVRIYNYTNTTYDMVFISIVTSSAHRGYELADLFLSRGSYVSIGGHHATLLPEEAMKHANTVFSGPAEDTFPLFFKDFLSGTAQKLYNADAFRQQCGCTRIVSAQPLAKRMLMSEKKYLRQPTIIADYGCPNNCKYCVIPSFWGHHTRRPTADVIHELQLLIASGHKEFLFLDPSPFGDLSYAAELLCAMKTINIRWAGLCALDNAFNPQLLTLLKESGCIGMLMGFESFSQNDLDSMNKFKNKVRNYHDAVHNLHEHGIVVLGTFMLGMDCDTKESLSELPGLIAETKIDVPRFAIVTPWPNTPYFNELDAENRILHRDWRQYDSVHCVFRPRNMSPSELEKQFMTVWRETYRPGAIMRRLRNTPQRKFTTMVTGIGFHIYANRINKLL